MAQTLDMIYVEEKHLPGQHDQQAHGGDEETTAGEPAFGQGNMEVGQRRRMTTPDLRSAGLAVEVTKDKLNDEIRYLVSLASPDAFEMFAQDHRKATVFVYPNGRTEFQLSVNRTKNRVKSYKLKGPFADAVKLHFDIDWIDPYKFIRAAESRPLVPKHMPGKHDQTSHAGGAATGAKQDTRAGTPPTTAKLYKEQLLKQRSALATQLEKAKKPEQQAELTKQLKELDKKIKAVPAVSKMTSAKSASLLKKRSALATEYERLANRSGPKAEARRQELKKKIGNIDTIIRENPLPKKVKKPKASVITPTPKPSLTATTSTTDVSTKKEKPQWRRNVLERARDWLKGAGEKIGQAFKTSESYTPSKINTIAAKQPDKRRDMQHSYDDWSRKQARANNTFKQVQNEFEKQQKNGIPSRKFYDMAVRFRTEQMSAASAKNKFELMIGFNSKSMVQDDRIEVLESSYEGMNNGVRSQ